MKKCVCYCMTRNIYGNILPSLKSLLKHNDIDQVYLLTEDDDIGFWLPANVKCINVAGQEFFTESGPNYHCRWTYMVMMRTVLCRIFQEESRMLALDLDTIIEGDISGLWDLPLDNYCMAAAREQFRHVNGKPYVNCGVVMWNLDRMRNGWADVIVKGLNSKQYDYCEQDCINELMQGQIFLMDSAYNTCEYTEPPQSSVKIRHYAAWGAENFLADSTVKKYGDMDWSEV